MNRRQKIRHGLILVSFFLFPATFYYLSPVLILEAAGEGVINGRFILFGLLFLSAFVLGRGWCRWLSQTAWNIQNVSFVEPVQIRAKKKPFHLASSKYWCPTLLQEPSTPQDMTLYTTFSIYPLELCFRITQPQLLHSPGVHHLQYGEGTLSKFSQAVLNPWWYFRICGS